MHYEYELDGCFAGYDDDTMMDVSNDLQSAMSSELRGSMCLSPFSNR